jgi:hypothetical protein
MLWVLSEKCEKAIPRSTLCLDVDQSSGVRYFRTPHISKLFKKLQVIDHVRICLSVPAIMIKK